MWKSCASGQHVKTAQLLTWRCWHTAETKGLGGSNSSFLPLKTMVFPYESFFNWLQKKKSNIMVCQYSSILHTRDISYIMACDYEYWNILQQLALTQNICSNDAIISADCRTWVLWYRCRSQIHIKNYFFIRTFFLSQRPFLFISNFQPKLLLLLDFAFDWLSYTLNIKTVQDKGQQTFTGDSLLVSTQPTFLWRAWCWILLLVFFNINARPWWI